MPSSNTETIFYLYKIENPNWSQTTEGQKDFIIEAITEGGWKIVSGLRRGFLNCKVKEDIAYGYFAEEGKLKIEQFDEYQQPEIGEQKSFERILFLLFLDAGILAVQSIRIARYLDLTGPSVRINLFGALESIFRNANFSFRGQPKFERYTTDLTRDELIQIFKSNKISRVVIRDLFNSSVPENFHFFNPDFDKDAFLKAIIEGDLKLSEKVEWEGSEIQQAKIVKGLMQAGNPSLVEGTDEYGATREWEQSSPETISLELNTDDVHFPDEDLNKTLSLIRRKFGVFSQRIESLKNKKDSGDLPLFNQR
jgi:hypothetical protein